jgi:GNAT superfamily N-acetyltransferase
MADHGSPRLRRFAPADIPATYEVFRRSLFDYLHRIGAASAEEAADPPIAEGWQRQRPWIEHLVATAVENWVAEDSDGHIIGWAMSVERDGLLELTHFFVDPKVRSTGLGRALIERAFPARRGGHRAIIATQDPPAISLYLRSGVHSVTTSMELYRSPEQVSCATDLVIEPLDPGDAAIRSVGNLESVILGHRRDVDVAFLLRQRPAWIARREGSAVGFAFGAEGMNAGPIAALDPADLPALLALVESDAAARKVETLSLVVPMVDHTAIAHLLARGFRIDPFYVFVLADADDMRLDRWVHTGPVFIL